LPALVDQTAGDRDIALGVVQSKNSFLSRIGHKNTRFRVHLHIPRDPLDPVAADTVLQPVVKCLAFPGQFEQGSDAGLAERAYPQRGANHRDERDGEQLDAGHDVPLQKLIDAADDRTREVVDDAFYRRGNPEEHLVGSTQQHVSHREGLFECRHIEIADSLAVRLR
jgi:hypothetical protein